MIDNVIDNMIDDTIKIGDDDRIKIGDDDRIKFEKCQERRQVGYLCDAHPTCEGCYYLIADNVYVALGGKLLDGKL